MNSERHKPDPDELPGAFRDALEDFAVGLISLEKMRHRIAETIESDPMSCEPMLRAFDAALREGLIKAASWETLTAEIDLATSEDEPTEWSEETRQVHGQETSEADGTIDPSEDRHDAEAGRAGGGATPGPIGVGMVLGGRYEILAHIGSGSMADVFKALDWHKADAGADYPWVAIKVISEAFSRHPAALETLREEARKGRELVHPNIVRIFEFDWDSDRFFLTMEYLDGEPLVELLNARHFKAMSLRRAMPIIEGLCHGLRHAHEQGIVHADVKPGNVFVTSAGLVKLLDFGIARLTATDADQAATPITGAHTPAYSSCEVLEGAAPTARDDVFSVACLAYRMLAGRRAFGSLTALEAERRRVEPRRIDSLEQRHWQALRHALAFRRAQRTESVSEFLLELGHRPAPPAPEAEPRYAEPEAPPARKRSGPLTIAVPTIALILGTAIAGWFWRGGAPTAPRPVVVTPLKPGAETPRSEPAPAPRAEAGPVGPPIELLAEPEVVEAVPTPLADAELPPAAAAPDPAPPVTPPEARAPRIAELGARADSAMNDGRLIEPAGDNARVHVDELGKIAAGSPEYEQRRTRLAELMLLEAMVAMTDEEFDTAERWLAETTALGSAPVATRRIASELTKARDAKSARDAGALEIFASATPAAILGPSGAENATRTDDGSGRAAPPLENIAPLAFVLPGPVKSDGAGKTADVEPQAQPTSVPLSALEFDRYVEPRFPRRPSTRRMSGWVELAFRVATDGRTADVEVLNAKPAGRFEQAAVDAVSAWRFKPVYADGVPTEKVSSVRLRFESE